MSRPRVLVLGGGFAGLACATSLDARDFAVTLVDRKRDFEFLPNIHELLSGVKKPAQLRLPLREQLQAAGHRFVRADVDRIDPKARRLASGGRSLQGDYLVIATGSADADFGVSGVRQHALGFKSVAQCQAIGRRLRTLRRAGGRVVVIGGGLEGIEALGEILRGDAFAKLDLTLVEARDRLLPDGPAAVAARLQTHCTARGVDVLPGDAVAKITAKTVFLKSGRRLPSDLTIWTGGPAPPTLLADAGLAAPGTWARVHDTLQHSRFAEVFIAGDSAALSRPLSKQAYHALDMGRQLAANIGRAARGQRLRRFRPAPKPTLIAFGDIDTLLIQGDFALAGPALAAAKEAVFTAVMTQLDQRAPADRLRALLSRGRNAGRTLLWPAVNNADSLLKQTKVVRVT